MRYGGAVSAFLLVVQLAVLALEAHAQRPSPAPPSRLLRRFSIDVRSAPLGTVANQLSGSLKVTLSVDPAFAEQRINVKANETTLTEFFHATERLLGGVWSASGEGGSASYRFVA